jgi:DNA-binding transcriptional LysR family regulator
MHKELNSIAIFIAVVDEGGFSKAAEKVGLTNSVISHHVTKLEESLGVTLLYRSTRQLKLSDQGQEFYTVASDALKLIEEAAMNLTSEGSDPSGQLHIAMPAFVPDPRLQELIWEFANLYENLELRISFSDDQKSLIQDGFDIAFRLGELESSSMISRKILDVELTLVASPELISKSKTIANPSDIAEMSCISLGQMRWSVSLIKGNMREEIQINNKRIEVDNIYAARDAAIAGLGLIPLPLGLCQQEIADSKLTQVLPEWHLSSIPLYALWNNKARRNSVTRRLLSFLTDNY